MSTTQKPLRRNLLLGQLAHQTQQIPEGELWDALSIQDSLSEDGISVLLGKICIDKGYLSRNALAHLLATQHAGRKARQDDLFGQITLANGLLERMELKRALLLQRRFRERRGKPAPPIGLILRQKELLSRAQVHAVLAAQRRLRQMDSPRMPRSARWRQLYWYVSDDDGPRGPLTDRELTRGIRTGAVHQPD